MKKVIKKAALFFAATVFVACSSNDNGIVPGQGATPVVYPMKGALDLGASKFMRNLEGTDKAAINSPDFGVDYFTLFGFFDNGSPSGKTQIQEKIVEVNLTIPKGNISVGEHLFTNTIVANEYFADMNIELNGVDETVNTVSGKINVLTYDNLTGKITGTYEIKTTDGITPQTHTITGQFNYIMLD